VEDQQQLCRHTSAEFFFLELMIAPAYRYKLEEHVEMKK
jgi:hypothetical protein